MKNSLPFLFHVNVSRNFWPSISMSSLIGTKTSACVAFCKLTWGSVSSKHKGKVRTFFKATLFRLIGVACGTASKWLEFGNDGIHCIFFLDFPSRGSGGSEVCTETALYLRYHTNSDFLKCFWLPRHVWR